MGEIMTRCGEYGRRLRGLLVTLVAWIETTFGHLVGGGTRASRAGDVLSPKDIIELATREVDKGALDWGQGYVDYPNHVEVLVGIGAWDRCFGLMAREAQERIAQALERHVGDRQGHLRAPEVVIAVDPLLGDEDVRVTARFCSTTHAAHTARMGQRDAAEPCVSSVSEHERVQCATPVDSPDTVAYPMASVRCGDRRFALCDTTTIGRSRYAGKERPDIDLKREEGFDSVSHLHGRFLCDERGMWSFVSEGRNGTRVVRKERVAELSAGESWSLRDGDSLRLGGSTRELVFSCA